MIEQEVFTTCSTSVHGLIFKHCLCFSKCSYSHTVNISLKYKRAKYHLCLYMCVYLLPVFNKMTLTLNWGGGEYQDISGPGHLGTEHMRHPGTGIIGTE